MEAGARKNDAQRSPADSGGSCPGGLGWRFCCPLSCRVPRSAQRRGVHMLCPAGALLYPRSGGHCLFSASFRPLLSGIALAFLISFHPRIFLFRLFFPFFFRFSSFLLLFF